MSFMPEETYKQIICYMKFMHIIYAYLCISMHICSGSEAIMKSFCGWASFLGGLKNGLRAQTSCDVKNVTLQLLTI